MNRFGIALLLPFVAALGGGCVGTIGDNANPAEQIRPFAPAAATLHRLTLAEYGATVRDLLGQPLVVPADLEVDTPLHGYASVGSSELTVSPHAAEQYEAAALGLAHQIFVDDARRTALVGCAPATSNDPCIKTFLSRFGRRAWRRPLTDAEVATLAQVAAQIGDSFRSPWTGVEYAVAGLLESPYFLFRVEKGVPVTDGSAHLRYDSFEMAGRLSYLLWGTTPDETLLDAAGRDELATAPGVRAQAERLLSSPRARQALGGFFTEYLNLNRLDKLSKDQNTFPEVTPTLGASMRGEVERLVEDVVFNRDGDVRELLDTRTTFVNAELAPIYGLALPDKTPDGYARVELPLSGPRAGLLTTPAILALYAHETVTSPTLRGKFIRQNLLCQDIPPPPPGVVRMLDDPKDGGPQTMREKLAAHRANPVCAGCHDLMDPLGLALENFDAIGVYRTTDRGLPIDTSAVLDGIAVNGARALGKLVKEDPRFSDCIVRQLYRRSTAHLELVTEEPVIKDLAARFRSGGYHFQSLVLDLIVSDGFRLALEDAP